MRTLSALSAPPRRVSEAVAEDEAERDEAAESPCGVLALHCTGDYLWGATTHGWVKVWETDTMNCAHSMQLPQCDTMTIVSGLGRVFTAGTDRSVRVWRTAHPGFALRCSARAAAAGSDARALSPSACLSVCLSLSFSPRPCRLDRSLSVRTLARRDVTRLSVSEEDDSKLVSILAFAGLSELLPLLREQQIDGTSVRLLTDQDLRELGLPLGPRRKLLRAVERFAALRPDFSSHGDEMLELLREFVALRSVSSDPARSSECWKAARLVQSLCEQMGMETRLIQAKADSYPLVFARFVSGAQRANPRPRRKVAIYGHYDVVNAAEGDGWLSPPFELTARNGYLYGRGTTDNKGPILAMLFAVRELIEETQGDLPTDVVVIIEGEEERDSFRGGFREGVAQAMDWLQGTDVVVVANSYWLSDNAPCLVYGMRCARAFVRFLSLSLLLSPARSLAWRQWPADPQRERVGSVAQPAQRRARRRDLRADDGPRVGALRTLRPRHRPRRGAGLLRRRRARHARRDVRPPSCARARARARVGGRCV
jgi:hypothetical protein